MQDGWNLFKKLHHLQKLDMLGVFFTPTCYVHSPSPSHEHVNIFGGGVLLNFGMWTMVELMLVGIYRVCMLGERGELELV